MPTHMFVCVHGNQFSSFKVLRQNFQIGRCGGLNKNDPHRLIYLDVWFSVDCLGRIKRCGLESGGGAHL